jgi:DNA-binding NarL/FixJ family response regulator
MVIKVLLAEDHAIVRQGLCSMIEKESDMEVVGQADDGREAVEQARQLHPDVVIMDVSMPKMNGIEATRQIKADMGGIKVLALSAHDNREYVTDMLDVGVSGYLLKDCVCSELIKAIRRVMKDESYLSPRIAAIVLDERYRGSRPPEIVLSEREKQLLRLLAEGKSAKGIAQQSNTNIKTIEAQRRRIKKKLGIDNLAGLVKYAIRERLISCDS